MGGFYEDAKIIDKVLAEQDIQMKDDVLRRKAQAEIKKMNPCIKCGVKGSSHLVYFKGYYRIGCGQCEQEHQGFTYAQEAVNFWNLENSI